MRSLPPARNQLRIGCRYVLWRQDFHLVIVSKASASWKTCTHMGKLAPTKGFERSSFRTDLFWTCSSHCDRPAYGSTFERWHQSGHGSRKLIRLLENAVAMAVETAKAEVSPWLDLEGDAYLAPDGLDESRSRVDKGLKRLFAIENTLEVYPAVAPGEGLS